MAGATGSAMAIADAGGLGSLPCAMLTPDQILEEVAIFRQHSSNAPLNLNFFCHQPPPREFHFGLPEQALLDRVRATDATIISSATTVEEAI
ncbi:2-nitropropane dioxygenase family oxidoreductase [Pseudomonas syringae pv. maculicola]|nr:2-nitropropane dioxygenase family oxidoreductase [Pseudomonas syringae pv. maculicola]